MIRYLTFYWNPKTWNQLTGCKRNSRELIEQLGIRTTDPIPNFDQYFIHIGPINVSWQKVYKNA